MRRGNLFPPMLNSRWLAVVLIVPLLILIALTTLQYREIEAGSDIDVSGSLLVSADSVSGARILNDYEDFYVVGRMFGEGDAISAYNNDALTDAQQRFTGTTTFMPWAYPPPLTAAVGLLPLVGLSWSYALFILGTLALYVWMLMRFGAQYVGAGLLAVYPALVLVVRLGQNGMLTGALIGLILLGLSQRQKFTGFALGLMMIKPHLAIAIGLVALLHRRWLEIGIAFVTALGLCIVATLVLGWQVWPAFIGGVSAAGGYLQQGLFPLYRMSSVYAGVRSFGFPASTAMTLHVIGAIIALLTVVVAWWRGMARNRLLALACFATLFVSPYNYDYDLVCLAAAVVLILPELLARARKLDLVLFYGFAWIGTGAGLAQHFNAVLIAGTTEHLHGSPLNWSFQALGLLAAMVQACLILRRPQTMGIVGQTAMPMMSEARL